MRISLDTSAYSALDRGHLQVQNVLEQADEVVISVVTIAELLAGFAGGSRADWNRSELQRFLGLEGVAIGSLDFATAERYAEIATHLRRQGTPPPTNDIWIAAHAMQHGFRVVTLDAHFTKMPQVSTPLFKS